MGGAHDGRGGYQGQTRTCLTAMSERMMSSYPSMAATAACTALVIEGRSTRREAMYSHVARTYVALCSCLWLMLCYVVLRCVMYSHLRCVMCCAVGCDVMYSHVLPRGAHLQPGGAVAVGEGTRR